MLGRKIGMTQVFTETGEAIPVTVLELGPNYVTQIKSPQVDGYEAVQLGYRESKKLNKPERELRAFLELHPGSHNLGQLEDMVKNASPAARPTFNS